MVSKDFAIIIITSIIILFLIVIFLVIKIQKLSKNNIKENFSSDDLAKVRTEINKIYDMDVEAIRNLGHISKSLLTGTNYHSTDPGTPGVLTIPANNTKFKGGIGLENTTWKEVITGHPNPASVGHILSDNDKYKKLMIVGNNTAGKRRKVGIWDHLQMYGGIGLENTTYEDTIANSHTNHAAVGHILSDNDHYKKLMIIGNNTAGGVRKVGIWDHLDVHGDLSVYGKIYQSSNRVRFIRVGTRYNGLNVREHFWTPRELVVYDIEGINVALDKPITIIEGSALSPSTPENIVDGWFPNGDNWHGDYRADGGNNINELEIDLGKEYNLEQIVLYNRQNLEYSKNLNGTTIELLNKKKNRTRLIHTGNWENTLSKEYLL